MKIIETPLAGLIVIETRIFKDSRGHFIQAYQDAPYQQLGIPPLVQDNISHSKQNVIRGLHYQLPNAQGKLVWVTRGKVWDVAVDIRLTSPTFGQWYATTLSEDNGRQMYIPPGFAHGYCTLSTDADFYYKCSSYYSPTDEHGIAWNDPALNINWPISNPILSDKDLEYANLNEIAANELFT